MTNDPFSSYPEKKYSIESWRELIGLVSAGAGIFVALLYLAGRSFEGGYFDSMNIPGYSLNFSIWEYGEVAWLPLLLYPIGMFIFTGVILGIFSSLGSWLSPLWMAFWNRLGRSIKFKPLSLSFPDIGSRARKTFSLVKSAWTPFLFIGFVLASLLFIRSWGAMNGQSYLLEYSPRVELVSASPMALDNPNLQTTQVGGLENKYYVYSRFHLLTVNAGKYYLFKEIDPATCKPLRVYVIDADQYKQVNLLAPESLSSQCHKTTPANQPAVPTIPPTSTP